MDRDQFEECGESIDESDWAELCERGTFRCELCKEEPLLEDLHTFIDTGLCNSCESKERRRREE
jgi:hypothetical protein